MLNVGQNLNTGGKPMKRWYATIWVAMLVWGSVLWANPIAADQQYEKVTYNHCWIVHNVEIQRIRGYDFEVDTWKEKCQPRTFYTWR
jgi:hypothetical protein